MTASDLWSCNISPYERAVQGTRNLLDTVVQRVCEKPIAWFSS